MKDEYLYASETCMFSTKITIPETRVRYKREKKEKKKKKKKKKKMDI